MPGHPYGKRVELNGIRVSALNLSDNTDSTQEELLPVSDNEEEQGDHYE